MNFHRCPIHGEEECLMGEDAMGHGCRGGQPLMFKGATHEREMSVVAKVVKYMTED